MKKAIIQLITFNPATRPTRDVGKKTYKKCRPQDSQGMPARRLARNRIWTYFKSETIASAKYVQRMDF